MTDEAQRLRDARAYDGAAEVYARVCAPLLFDAPARALVDAVAPPRGSRVLDVGSGTGAVARAARSAVGADALVAAVDPALDMLLAARRGGVDPVVVGSLPRLPFANASFDVVFSAFVLTHVDDPDAALADVARVLRPGGRAGVSAWAAGDDEFFAAWSEVVGRYVETERMNRAAEVILPGESKFSQPTGLVDALRAGGFASVRSHDAEFSFQLTVEEYVQGREACASGRALRALLSSADWRRLTSEARAVLAARFPRGVAYRRRVYMASGRLLAC
jgi:ubiquinone/menaquinone biosynthesis C-methylase UbiE